VDRRGLTHRADRQLYDLVPGRILVLRALLYGHRRLHHRRYGSASHRLHFGRFGNRRCCCSFS